MILLVFVLAFHFLGCDRVAVFRGLLAANFLLSQAPGALCRGGKELLLFDVCLGRITLIVRGVCTL